MGAFAELKQRRAARRWQRWTEVDPDEDLHRRVGIGMAVVVSFFVLLIALVVVGFVVAR